MGILGLEPGDSISDNPKSTDFQEAGEEPGYIQACSKQGTGNLNIQRLLLIKRKLNLSCEEI